LLRQDVLESLFGQFERQLATRQRREGNDPVEQTFQFTDVRSHLLGNEERYVIR
jgi:hypothetical protein